MRPLLLLVALQVFPATVLARTWEVKADGSGDAPTIQAGIDSSTSGDTILVYAGTYSEAIDFLSKDVVLESVEGPATTRIDGTQTSDTVVKFIGGETRWAVGFIALHHQDYLLFPGGEAPHTAWPMNAGGLDRCHPRAQKRRLLVESFCHNDPGSYDDIRQSESPRHLPEVDHENGCLASSSLLPRQDAYVSR